MVLVLVLVPAIVFLGAECLLDQLERKAVCGGVRGGFPLPAVVDAGSVEQLFCGEALPGWAICPWGAVVTVASFGFALALAGIRDELAGSVLAPFVANRVIAAEAIVIATTVVA
jgi:hypothetical protein